LRGKDKKANAAISRNSKKRRGNLAREGCRAAATWNSNPGKKKVRGNEF